MGQENYIPRFEWRVVIKAKKSSIYYSLKVGWVTILILAPDSFLS